MIKVTFGDDQGGIHVDFFNNEQEANRLADRETRKLTILKIDELETGE